MVWKSPPAILNFSPNLFHEMGVLWINVLIVQSQNVLYQGPVKASKLLYYSWQSSAT